VLDDGVVLVSDEEKDDEAVETLGARYEKAEQNVRVKQDKVDKAQAKLFEAEKAAEEANAALEVARVKFQTATDKLGKAQAKKETVFEEYTQEIIAGEERAAKRPRA
jgi:hypothetical protein